MGNYGGKPGSVRLCFFRDGGQERHCPREIGVAANGAYRRTKTSLQGWAKLEIASFPPLPDFREVGLGHPRCRKLVESLAVASYNFAELSVRLDLPANPEGSFERLCGAVLPLAWYIFHRGLSTVTLAGICPGLESAWFPRFQVLGEHNCSSKLALGEFREPAYDSQSSPSIGNCSAG